MEMRDNLPTAPFHIEEKLVPRFSNCMLPCHLLRHEYHLGNGIPIPFCQVIEAPDMPSRHNEQMDRGMGMNVLEDHYRFALMQKISRFFTPNDLAEGAILFHGSYRVFAHLLSRRIASSRVSSLLQKQKRTSSRPCLRSFQK